MTYPTALLRDLVIANRILSNEGIVDAYGLGVRTDESANEDMRRQSGQRSRLEHLDRRPRHLRGCRNIPDGQRPFFTGAAKAASKVLVVQGV